MCSRCNFWGKVSGLEAMCLLMVKGVEFWVYVSHQNLTELGRCSFGKYGIQAGKTKCQPWNVSSFNSRFLFTSQGGDDRRVLLWHMEQAIHSRVKPIQLKGEHHSNIFCLAFNSGNTKVFSGGEKEISPWEIVAGISDKGVLKLFLDFPSFISLSCGITVFP